MRLAPPGICVVSNAHRGQNWGEAGRTSALALVAGEGHWATAGLRDGLFFSQPKEAADPSSRNVMPFIF